MAQPAATSAGSRVAPSRLSAAAGPWLAHRRSTFARAYAQETVRHARITEERQADGCPTSATSDDEGLDQAARSKARGAEATEELAAAALPIRRPLAARRRPLRAAQSLCRPSQPGPCNRPGHRHRASHLTLDPMLG